MRKTEREREAQQNKNNIEIAFMRKKICAKQILNEQKRFSRTTNMILRISIFN